MTVRRQCLVPFCKHGTRRFAEDGDWICSQHWRHVSRTKKRRLRLAYRRWCVAVPSSREQFRWGQIWHRAWARCKKEAIEAAVGIA